MVYRAGLLYWFNWQNNKTLIYSLWSVSFTFNYIGLCVPLQAPSLVLRDIYRLSKPLHAP